MLSKFGMSSAVDDLELKLNRAAEAAIPKAKILFGNAISDMSIEDVKKILNGLKDSATQYSRGKMSAPLARDMKPIVNSQLSQVGAIASYDNLTDYVLHKAIAGVFLYLGREEAAIRETPAKRAAELSKKVFGR